VIVVIVVRTFVPVCVLRVFISKLGHNAFGIRFENSYDFSFLFEVS
jgi:hypothetical protein